MTIRRFLFALPFVVVAMVALSHAACAQEDFAPPRRALAKVLTAEQLDAFVDITGDPKPLVWQRLLADPDLVPYAAAAANARTARRSSGKAMMITGFTILGVGTVAGYVLVIAGLVSGADCNSSYGDSYSRSCEPNGSMMVGGLVLMLASIGTGLGIGIPGIISVARKSEAENEAYNRYQYPGLPSMPPYPRAYSMGSRLQSPARTIGVPLLSFSF